MKTMIGSIVRVDHSIFPTYPSGLKIEVMNPELFTGGPVEFFDVMKLDQWMHPDQEGDMKGSAVYEYLRENKMLASCLGVRDLEEIKKEGPDFFRKHFRGKKVFGWRSIAKTIPDEDHGNTIDFIVPYLIESRSKVVLS